MKVKDILESVINDNQPFFLMEYDSWLFRSKAFSQRIYELVIFQSMPDGFAALEMDAHTFRQFIKANNIPKRHQEDGEIVWAYDDKLKELWKKWEKESEPYRKAVRDLEIERAKLATLSDEASGIRKVQIKHELVRARAEYETFRTRFLNKHKIITYR